MNAGLNTTCPSCSTDGMRSFYRVEGVPVHSCLMFENERDALEFPTGDIELGFCKSCGFITNMAFDPNVQDYSPQYEDQQCLNHQEQHRSQNPAGNHGNA